MKKIAYIVDQFDRVQKINVTKGVANRYLISIHPSTEKGKKYRLGTFCENCGILIGNNHIFKKPRMYYTFYVCDDCFGTLSREIKTKKQVSSPNINDFLFNKCNL